MLTLVRRQNERLVILVKGHDPIFVEVIRGGAQVKLSIDAPPEVGVHREEVWERIKRERECKL